MWRDLDNVIKTDCQLCGGAGFYEVIFEFVKSGDYKQHRLVKSFRAYGTGQGRMQGYRTMTRCHLCRAAYHRGVPDAIISWQDGQIDELLSRENNNGDAPF